MIQAHGKLRRRLPELGNAVEVGLAVADMFEFHNVSELARHLDRRDAVATRRDDLPERARRQQQAMEDDRLHRARRPMRDA
jgi:hypothetical protein